MVLQSVQKKQKAQINSKDSKSLLLCTGKNARAAQQAALKNVVGYDFKLIAGYKGLRQP